MKKKKLLAVLLVALLAVGGWLFWQSQVTAEKERAARELTLSGNVDVREVSLAFRASDRIAQLYFEEGDTVKAGDVLGELVSTELSLNIAKAQAQVAAQESAVDLLHNGNRAEDIAAAYADLKEAEANSLNLRGTAARYQQIYDDVAGISRQELDDALAAAAAADARTRAARETYDKAVNGARVEEVKEGEANLAALQEELARQEYLLSETKLIAPADGVIRSRLLEPGDMASPSAPVYRLSLLDKKWVRVYVNEADLGRIHEGQAATVLIDSFPDEPIAGQIGYISSTAEFTPKTVQTDELRTALLYEVRVYVDDPENRLRLGMPATVKVALQDEND